MRRPTLPRLPALPRPPVADVAQWSAAALVIASGWAAGRGLAVGMDTVHCAAAGFAVSGSIFLAVTLRDEVRSMRSARG